MSHIMTVLGPVAADTLGIVLPHEHLLCDMRRVTGNFDHLVDDAMLAIKEVMQFKDAGGTSLVDVTSWGLGRDPRTLQHISQETGLHIVMGCGWYRESFFDRPLYESTVDEIAAEIVAEINDGVGDTGVRAGIIGEVGSDKHFISPAEERSLRAAARAHRQTGLTITTHAVLSPVGLAQLDLLEEEGVDLRRVIVGHCDGYPHPDYHQVLAKRGAYVEFDTFRGRYSWDVHRRLGLVTEFIQRGYLEHLLLSHDICWKSHLKAYGGTGYDFLLTEFVPMLQEAGLSQEQIHILLVENPRRALSGED